MVVVLCGYIWPHILQKSLEYRAVSTSPEHLQQATSNTLGTVIEQPIVKNPVCKTMQQENSSYIFYVYPRIMRMLYTSFSERKGEKQKRGCYDCRKEVRLLLLSRISCSCRAVPDAENCSQLTTPAKRTCKHFKLSFR